MSKEILFRGIRIDNDKVVEGDLINYHDAGWTCIKVYNAQGEDFEVMVYPESVQLVSDSDKSEILASVRKAYDQTVLGFNRAASETLLEILTKFENNHVQREGDL